MISRLFHGDRIRDCGHSPGVIFQVAAAQIRRNRVSYDDVIVCTLGAWRQLS
jgi:hypothetical protein